MQRYHVYLVVWGLFLVALSLIPGRQVAVHRFPVDKLLHAVAFMYLGYLAARSLGWWGLLVVVAFGAAHEFVQFIAPYREVAFLDIIANEAGAVAGFFAGFLRRRRALQAS